jgi:RNA polymerase sigma factor (sigma-70 family)
MNGLQSLTDSRIKETARKIFGFAIGKLGNRTDAEDLTQDILLALVRSIRSGRPIDNMDAWLYRICQYTWSNYLSKQKRHWHYSDVDQVQLTDESDTPEEEFVRKESLELLKREMAYLSKIHRTIGVMFYYENRSVAAIAEQLNIPAGTVKWHLHETRSKLKEAMRLETSTKTLSLTPARLNVGHNGTPGPKGEPNSYFTTLLAQNIAIAAYEKPLTNEEIARTLQVSSAYIEDFIERFIYSDVLCRVGKDKVQTNFIIRNMESYIAKTAFLRKKAEELAEPMYEAVLTCLEDWKELGFHGSQCGDTFLLWALLPYAIHYQYYHVKEREYYDRYKPIERKDGGQYRAVGSIQYDEQAYKINVPDYERARKYNSGGIKTRGSGSYKGRQMETWWTGMPGREFNSSDVVSMYHMIKLIETGAAHTEYDKELIARMARLGFVSCIGGKLECLIPFFKADQFSEFTKIMERAYDKIGAKAALEQVHDGITAMWESLAPRHIAKDEVVHTAMHDGNAIVFAIMEQLTYTGRLALPDEDEKKRLTTLMWMDQSEG